MGERRRTGRRWLLLAVAALVLVGSGAAIANRRPLLERWLLWQLRERGIDDAALSVEHFGADGLTIGHVRIGDGDLELRALELRYSLRSLLHMRLDALRIAGLRVRGVLAESGVRLGALDALLRNDGATPARRTRFPALPTARLEVTETNLVLDTAEGPFVATVAVQLDEAGDGRVVLAANSFPGLETALGLGTEPFAIGGTVTFRPERAALALDPAPFSLTLARSQGIQHVRGTTPAVEVVAEPGGAETLHLRTSGGELSLPDLGLQARGFEIDAGIAEASGLPQGSLAVRDVRDLRKPPWITPLALTGSFSPDGGSVALEGALTGAAGRLALRARGSHDPATGQGRLELALDPLHFETGGLRPADLAPASVSLIRTAQGAVEATGEFTWGEAGPDGFVDVGVLDLNLDTPAAHLERLNAALHLQGPWPPRTGPGQLVSMARLDFGLELTNGLVKYAVRPDRSVEIERAQWDFAGGTIRTQGTLDLARQGTVALTAKDVDLTRLLELVNLQGLSGTGRLRGSLPLVMHGDVIEIRNAVLEATEEGGWIHYAPVGQATAVASAAGMAFDDLLIALRNFRYQKLRLTINGEAQGEVTVALSLLGANPEHRDAQPYEFNLNVEGRLGDLVRQSEAAYQIPAEIEKRLSEIAEGSR